MWLKKIKVLVIWLVEKAGRGKGLGKKPLPA